MLRLGLFHLVRKEVIRELFKFSQQIWSLLHSSAISKVLFTFLLLTFSFAKFRPVASFTHIGKFATVFLQLDH